MEIVTRQLIPELSVVNNETGELLAGVTKIKCRTQEEFIMCFLNSLSVLMKLDGYVMKVLLVIWKCSTFNPNGDEANSITNSKVLKDEVRKYCPTMTDDIINHAFTELKKKEILLRQCRGVYKLNPVFFFKGSLTQRSRLLAHIEFVPPTEDDNSPTSAAHPTGDDIV